MIPLLSHLKLNPKNPTFFPFSLTLISLFLLLNLPSSTPFNPNFSSPQDSIISPSMGAKKLRRLPHVFSKVLELPLNSDADVSVEETRDCFRFVALADDLGGNLRTHLVEVHPGVIKVVIRKMGQSEPLIDEMGLDVWRFRLPAVARAAEATAVYAGGKLVVVVPKGGGCGGVGWGVKRGSVVIWEI